jgi:hypothetical protein
MSGRIAFLLFTLSLSVYSCAQEGADERGWTDKNNTEMYAAYMLQHSYNEQGYWGAKVETRQSGTKRVFVVEPGRIYHVKHFDVSGLSGLPEHAMKTRREPGTCTRQTASTNGLRPSKKEMPDEEIGAHSLIRFTRR